jgi:hypothetical protein
VFRLKRQIRLDQLRLIQTFKISTIHPNRESRSRPRRKGVGNYELIITVMLLLPL